MKKEYLVVEHERFVAQEGERYCWDMECSEGNELYCGESLEEARVALMEAENRWNCWRNVINHKRGLPTVEYMAADLCELTYDDDDEEMMFPNCETLDSVRSLDRLTEKKLRKIEREYWDFLDYREDFYTTEF